MDNELMFIAERLYNEYGNGRHFEIVKAVKDGEIWSLKIKETTVTKDTQEQKDDN